MFKHYVKRTIRKMIAIPFFLIFGVISLVVKPVSLLLRLISLPCSIVALAIAGINLFNNGPLNITALSFIICVSSGFVYITMPYFPSFVYTKFKKFKKIVFYPIVIRPPVRFTV